MRRDTAERAGSFTPVLEIEARDAAKAPVLGLGAQEHDPIIGVRQTAVQQGRAHREHGVGHADADRQHQYCGEREPAVTFEEAKREGDVLRQALKP